MASWVILVTLTHGKAGILILAHSTRNSSVRLVTWLSKPNLSHENNARVLWGSQGSLISHVTRDPHMAKSLLTTLCVMCWHQSFSKTLMNFFEKWPIYLQILLYQTPNQCIIYTYFMVDNRHEFHDCNCNNYTYNIA